MLQFQEVKTKKGEKIFSFTFYCDLVLSSVGVSENLYMDGHLSHGIVHPRAWQETESEGHVNAFEFGNMDSLCSYHRPNTYTNH